MNAKEFEQKAASSTGLSLIVAGLGTLVDDEGYTTHEAFRLLDYTKNNIFPALMQMEREKQ